MKSFFMNSIAMMHVFILLFSGFLVAEPLVAKQKAVAVRRREALRVITQKIHNVRDSQESSVTVQANKAVDVPPAKEVKVAASAPISCEEGVAIKVDAPSGVKVQNSAAITLDRPEPIKIDTSGGLKVAAAEGVKVANQGGVAIESQEAITVGNQAAVKLASSAPAKKLVAKKVLISASTAKGIETKKTSMVAMHKSPALSISEGKRMPAPSVKKSTLTVALPSHTALHKTSAVETGKKVSGPLVVSRSAASSLPTFSLEDRMTMREERILEKQCEAIERHNSRLQRVLTFFKERVGAGKA